MSKEQRDNFFTNTKSYVKEKINTKNIKEKLQVTKNEIKDLSSQFVNKLNNVAEPTGSSKLNQQ